MRKEPVIELVLNAVSHGLGIVMSVFALVFLLLRVDNSSEMFGILVFGISMIILYVSSTLYHSFPKSLSRVSGVFRRLDHSAIYLLIAGTYTPFVWVLVPTTQGYVLLSILWLIAIVGVVLKSVLFYRFKAYHMVMYLLMGWSIIFVSSDVMAVIPDTARNFLFAGGIAYTTGVIFFALKNIRFMHLVWHFFVLTGSLLHFLSIYHII